MKVLITGITGFSGSHLAEYCLAQGVEVYGTRRNRSRLENIEAIRDRVHLEDCDILDPKAMLSVVRKTKPDYIFHLAAQAFVPTSWKAPTGTITTNVLGELNLFEAVREIRDTIDPKYSPRIQIACSSEEYGLVLPKETPIRETNPLRPMSPYAVSKVAQDYLGYQYFKSYGLEIVRTRAFNHSGPRRGDVYVDSDFAKQLVEIETGLRELSVIEVGNLEAQRDFTDVRDTVRGYWLALEKGEAGEVYNICSGRAWSINRVLASLIKLSALKKVKVIQDSKRMRPSDVPILRGDFEKFRRATGWTPKIRYEQTLRDTLNYWREQLQPKD